MTIAQILARALVALLLSWGAAARAAPPELVLYTYHDKPPYNLRAHDDRVTAGIYADFAAFLNEHQQALHVSIEFMPRKRLEHALSASKLEGGIVGVHPLWFGDAERSKYLWTRPFMHDTDVVVVRVGVDLAYKKPADLIGRTVALPRGLYFFGITELGREGKIKIEETSSDLQNLKMVRAGRADATITSAPTLRYLTQSDESLARGVRALTVPHDRFERFVLLPPGQQAVQAVIDRVLAEPRWRKAWDDQLRRQGVDVD